MASTSELRIAVIGAGPAGIVTGRELLAQGFDRFTIFEKAAAVGGTWHLHSYPGLACDVKAAAYTFSGHTRPDWTHSFAERHEIEVYLQRCASEFGLDPHVRLDTCIVSARYQSGGTWELFSAAGERFEFDVVINAMGNQHTPLYPDLTGMDSFEGDSWHSTQWNHEVSLEGKRVAVVGSAAAAVQIVPEVAKVAGHLYVLQRTPNWILPRGRKPYAASTRAMLRLGFLQTLHRGLHRKIMHLAAGAFLLGHKTQARVESMGRRHLEKSIRDPELRELVRPKSRFGCKRPLMSDWFYPALERENVTLVPAAAKTVNETGLVTDAGEELAVDVIVYCTGYKVMDFDRIDGVGRNGASLGKRLAEAPEAYKGFAVPGFPNHFFALGPNSLVPTASFFDSAEVNVACIVRLLREKQEAGIRAMDVRESALQAYNAWIQGEREAFSWGVDACSSYYRTPAGHTPFLFPGEITVYKRQRDASGLHDFETV